MAGQHDGYAIGVDLGTSNTVAVLRWPDGRTRPLLFDGQPIMPSAVFLDSSGRLHVGRDAQRLAQADPARYEPNPKRRVDEAGVLLGDREVPTVELLAALLRTVAQAAVEAVGFLPPAVLTYPAGWGARRREVLIAAVGRAGWPPVRGHAGPAGGPLPGPGPGGGTMLVPEPVAAARYFADVLRRPVPVGSSLAVFDFGGGTLDIAVVRNEGVDEQGRARFAVIGSGGIAELGGLDLDAAIVDHLGGVIGSATPDVWRELTQPTSTTGWRNRRRFWDDVRGAKEMLSRTTVAPVPVPGVDQAVHLTRDELERLAAPLLRRAVFEATAVIANCRLAPHQLAGLFLVGGSSRVPLVARLLHADLGIAPTVLEQPELPVAEGALAEAMLSGAGAGAGAGVGVGAGAGAVVPAGSQSSAAGVPGAPTSPAGRPGAPGSPGAPVSARPTSPAAPLGGPAYPAGAAPGDRRSRRAVWIVAAAVLALVGVVGAAVLYLTRGGYDEIEFQTFADIGRIEISEENASYTHTAVLGDRAYVAVERGDDRLDVVAAEAATAKELWSFTTSSTSDRWLQIVATPDALLVFADAIGATTPRGVTVLDPSDGTELWSVDLLGEDEVRIFEDVLVVVDRTANRLVGRDLRSGRERWTQDTPEGPYDFDTAVHTVTTDEDLGGPGTFAGGPQAQVRDDDQRIVQISADRSARVIDVTTGKVLRSRTNVAEPDDTVLAHDGRLYVAAAEGGYWLAEYDLAGMGEPRNLYRAPDDRRRIGGLVPCGQRQVCLLETVSSDRATTELVAVDTEKQGERWRRKAADRRLLVPVGEHVMVGSDLGDYRVEIFGTDGDEVSRGEGVAARVDGGNLLLFAENPTSFPDDASVIGIQVGSGNQIQLGLLKAVRAEACSWNAEVIVCPSDSDFVFRRFAKD